MTDVDVSLNRATRGVLAVWTGAPGNRRLLAVPSALWWDGAGVWLAGAGASEAADALKSQPSCTVLLAESDLPDVAVRGQARVHGLHDPLGLALHGPAIAGAVGVLALRDPAVPRRLGARGVAIRVAAAHREPLSFPPSGEGLTPALPAEVPADVRRALAGVRAVVVLDAVRPTAAGATWDGGMRLSAPVDAGSWCAVVALTADTGLVLEGPCDSDGRLRPERAQWWRGELRGAAPVRAGGAALVMPE